MPNSYRGEVVLAGIGTIRFTWERIARLVDTFGAEWDSVISRATLATDVKTIAAAVAIGTGLDTDEVMKASPPIQATITALMAALHLAFHGAKGATPSSGESRPTLATLLRMLAKSLLRRG